MCCTRSATSLPHLWYFRTVSLEQAQASAGVWGLVEPQSTSGWLSAPPSASGQSSPFRVPLGCSSPSLVGLRHPSHQHTLTPITFSSWLSTHTRLERTWVFQNRWDCEESGERYLMFIICKFQLLMCIWCLVLLYIFRNRLFASEQPERVAANAKFLWIHISYIFLWVQVPPPLRALSLTDCSPYCHPWLDTPPPTPNFVSLKETIWENC